MVGTPKWLKTEVCASNEYISTNACTVCPITPVTATCNGFSVISCGTGYLSAANTCSACPVGGTCDGTATFTCKSPLVKSSNKCLCTDTT